MYGPIKINLSLAKLRAINEELNRVGYEPTNVRQERVERSILHEVGIRLMKKQLDVFPRTKPFTYKLKYHEAASLENFLRSLLWLSKEPISENHRLRRIVADDINQKLA